MLSDCSSLCLLHVHRAVECPEHTDSSPAAQVTPSNQAHATRRSGQRLTAAGCACLCCSLTSRQQQSHTGPVSTRETCVQQWPWPCAPAALLLLRATLTYARLSQVRDWAKKHLQSSSTIQPVDWLKAGSLLVVQHPHVRVVEPGEEEEDWMHNKYC